MKAWIVVPVFDEASTVGAVVASVRRHAPVIVVDDGSCDASAAVARAAGAEVVRHPRRLGKGQALRTGLAAARQRGATHVVTVDGDGQHAPEDVPRLLALARRAPDAIVVGTRVDARGDAGGVPAGRLNAIRVAGFFLNWASGLRIEDSQSGFRVYPIAALDALRVRRGGFVFETEVLVAAAARGVPVLSASITVIPRASRRSRFRPIGDGVAIGAFLAARAARRWGVEAGAAAREVAALFDRPRRQARHRAMLEAATMHGGSVAACGAALSAVALHRAVARLAAWWDHPRRRRAVVAAEATLAAPLVLACAVAQGLGGRRAPDVVTPLVQRFYAQTRLNAMDVERGARAPSRHDAEVVPTGELS